jgi:hypothetical protein
MSYNISENKEEVIELNNFITLDLNSSYIINTKTFTLDINNLKIYNLKTKNF